MLDKMNVFDQLVDALRECMGALEEIPEGLSFVDDEAITKALTAGDLALTRSGAKGESA